MPLQHRLQTVHALARKHLKGNQIYQKHYNYDSSLRLSSYKVGDAVYMFNKASKTGESGKLCVLTD